jgi:hypothetical protein
MKSIFNNDGVVRRRGHNYKSTSLPAIILLSFTNLIRLINAKSPRLLTVFSKWRRQRPFRPFLARRMSPGIHKILLLQPARKHFRL